MPVYEFDGAICHTACAPTYWWRGIQIRLNALRYIHIGHGRRAWVYTHPVGSDIIDKVIVNSLIMLRGCDPSEEMRCE